MKGLVDTDTLAPALGLPKGTLLAWHHRGILPPGFGRIIGKRRFYDVGEACFLVILKEMVGQRPSLPDAVNELVHLWPKVVEIAAGQHGDDPVFAIRATGLDGEERVLAIGYEQMAEAAIDLTRKCACGLHVVNLSVLVGLVRLTWPKLAGQPADAFFEGDPAPLPETAEKARTE